MKLAQVSSPVRTVFHGAGQFLAIALYFAAIAGIIHYSVAAHNVASEASLIELSQLILLAASVFTFRRIAHVHCAYNSAASLMSAFFLVLMIRELDATLDMVFHGFGKSRRSPSRHSLFGQQPKTGVKRLRVWQESSHLNSLPY
ncbi:hypothetical protein [Salinivibrio sp. YCSC6]|uniref:hypothetical protein n=1 Tax=Salinivibrio sp. YCSC6 TaxID=2003370 RepID=UPI000BBCD412|nr:hypothetical protein [Salinivibrio sp. YCSC6]PCE65247.1 hypothetical protein B6G00_14770 [Salinivibrio sp. YCSC6]